AARQRAPFRRPIPDGGLLLCRRSARAAERIERPSFAEVQNGQRKDARGKPGRRAYLQRRSHPQPKESLEGIRRPGGGEGQPRAQRRCDQGRGGLSEAAEASWKGG